MRNLIMCQRLATLAAKKRERGCCKQAAAMLREVVDVVTSPSTFGSVKFATSKLEELQALTMQWSTEFRSKTAALYNDFKQKGPLPVDIMVIEEKLTDAADKNRSAQSGVFAGLQELTAAVGELAASDDDLETALLSAAHEVSALFDSNKTELQTLQSAFASQLHSRTKRQLWRQWQRIRIGTWTVRLCAAPWSHVHDQCTRVLASHSI